MRWILLCTLSVAVISHVSDDYHFNYYVFAQQWPASFCFDEKSTRNADHCYYAKNITTWTNHGLWPSVNETYPNYCNDSWPLKEAEFSLLEDQMRARWPSFGGKDQDFSFWEHEWVKHGTCAASEPALRGPYKYFKKALQLNTMLDFKTQLAKNLRLEPSKVGYNYTRIYKAANKYYGESLLFGCTWDNQAKKQHLAQIEVCFNKTFTMNCNLSVFAKRKPTNYMGPRARDMPRVETCHENELVYYYSIEHQGKN